MCKSVRGLVYVTTESSQTLPEAVHELECGACGPQLFLCDLCKAEAFGMCMNGLVVTYPKANGYEAGDDCCAPSFLVLRCQFRLLSFLFCIQHVSHMHRGQPLLRRRFATCSALILSNSDTKLLYLSLLMPQVQCLPGAAMAVPARSKQCFGRL